jgi:hypothetical protein
MPPMAIHENEAAAAAIVLVRLPLPPKAKSIACSAHDWASESFARLRITIQ